jgi:hypothetical protein
VVNDDLDTDKYINDNTESDHKVTLSENDHQDLVEIFKNIFPDCSTKMSNFLMSQKRALERHVLCISLLITLGTFSLFVSVCLLFLINFLQLMHDKEALFDDITGKTFKQLLTLKRTLSWFSYIPMKNGL